MITSGKDLRIIVEKISILQTYITSSGKLNRTDVHKECEKFVMELLNLAYGYDLETLNTEHNQRFPGLDLGDKNAGIGFQVTSDKSLAKIEDTFSKVISHELYLIYPRIKFFMLLGKQSSYSLRTDTTTYFEFSAKADILDFDDLIARIETCSAGRIAKVREYIDLEIDGLADAIRSEESDARGAGLIDIQSALDQSGMTHYRHCRFNIDLIGDKISAAKILTRLDEILNIHDKRIYLPMFYRKNLKEQTSSFLVYRQDRYEAGASNNLKESVLAISGNSVIFEFAQYLDNENFVTNLNEELGSLLTLLLVLKGCSSLDSFHLSGEIGLSCSARLSFNAGSSLFKVGGLFGSYELDPAGHSTRFEIYRYDAQAILDLIQEVIYGFPAKVLGFGDGLPFLRLDIEQQNISLSELQRRIFPPEF